MFGFHFKFFILGITTYNNKISSTQQIFIYLRNGSFSFLSISIIIILVFPLSCKRIKKMFLSKILVLHRTVGIFASVFLSKLFVYENNVWKFIYDVCRIIVTYYYYPLERNRYASVVFVDKFLQEQPRFVFRNICCFFFFFHFDFF